MTGMKTVPKLFMLVPPIAIIAIMVIAARPPWTALRIVGVALTAFAVAMLTLARAQLGNSFAVTAQAKELVTAGIYSRIRHPIYVFSALTVAGLLLYFARPHFLLLLLVLVPVQIWRARIEERVLEKKFGEAYAQYKQRTWF